MQVRVLPWVPIRGKQLYNIIMSASWTDIELQRLVERRRRYARLGDELLLIVKSFTPEMWKDDVYRWLGKLYKDLISECNQNVKCCTMLLEYFNGKTNTCNISKELEPIFLLCCGELEFGYMPQ